MLKWLIAAGLAMSAAAVAPMTAQAEADWRAVKQSMQPIVRRAHRSDQSPIPRQVVRYEGRHAAETIIVDTTERRLYYTLGNGKAIKYGVGVGKEGFTWAGANRISRKAEWPGWTPPPQMIRREAAKGRTLPAYMEGAPTIRSARVHSISAPRFTVFTGPTNLGPSARQCRRAASAWPMTT